MGELLNKNYMAKNLENGGILGKKVSSTLQLP
jgi:hypothetical protein